MPEKTRLVAGAYFGFLYRWNDRHNYYKLAKNTYYHDRIANALGLREEEIPRHLTDFRKAVLRAAEPHAGEHWKAALAQWAESADPEEIERNDPFIKKLRAGFKYHCRVELPRKRGLLSRITQRWAPRA